MTSVEKPDKNGKLTLHNLMLFYSKQAEPLRAFLDNIFANGISSFLQWIKEKDV